MLRRGVCRGLGPAATAGDTAARLHNKGVTSVWDTQPDGYLGLICGRSDADLDVALAEVDSVFARRVGVSRPFAVPTEIAPPSMKPGWRAVARRPEPRRSSDTKAFRSHCYWSEYRTRPAMSRHAHLARCWSCRTPNVRRCSRRSKRGSSATARPWPPRKGCITIETRCFTDCVRSAISPAAPSTSRSDAAELYLALKAVRLLGDPVR